MYRSFALAVLLAVLTPLPVVAQSLEEMAGQMILVGFAGDGIGDKSVAAVRDEIASGGLGGVMYLQTNVKSLAAVRAMNKAFRAASPNLPPFIALDQEGGKVERLTSEVGFREIPSARDVAATESPASAEALYGRMAASLADLGFTVNFGPVVDLDINPDNPIIGRYGRSFSADPAKVTAYAEAFVNAHHKAGLLTALKHFPGHGSSTTDSHKGFVDITKTWRPSELEPYRQLIGEGLADMVMVGHLYHARYSGGGSAELPASLSPGWIGMLREDLGYDGVIISDDLEMGAIRKRFTLEDTIGRAVMAGVDVLLFSNTADPSPHLADTIRAMLVKKGAADPAFRARIEESYRRIVALKQRLID